MTDWERRAQELFLWRGEDCRTGEFVPLGAAQRALLIAREMADARAEEIAKVLDEHHRKKSYCADVATCWFYAAGVARSFISKKRTREEVLEEALRAIEAACPPGFPNTDPRDWSLTRDGGERAASVARRALEWKP